MKAKTVLNEMGISEFETCEITMLPNEEVTVTGEDAQKFNELLDMPLSTYKLQLSLYENALYYIGMKVVGRRILWLKPDSEYEKINLESYRKELDIELKKIYD